MTAALILEPRERTETRQLTVVRPEPRLIVDARAGDAAALESLLDLVSDRVYSYAFEATHKSRAAEVITDAVVQRLPRVLRRQRWDTIEALTAALMSISRSEVGTYNRRTARGNASSDVRALTRHAFLAATSVATIVYAGILAF